MRDLGAEVVAISGTPPEEARGAAGAARLPFPVLSDPARTVIGAYGVRHDDEPEGRAAARPALFLIDRAGMVRYAHVGEHARDRPAIGAVLLALESMA